MPHEVAGTPGDKVGLAGREVDKVVGDLVDVDKVQVEADGVGHVVPERVDGASEQVGGHVSACAVGL